MTGMHADEIAIGDETVRRLLADQLPEWADLPLVRLPPAGTDNQLFRLGDDLLIRMPRVPGPAETGRAPSVASRRWTSATRPDLGRHTEGALACPVRMTSGRISR